MTAEQLNSVLFSIGNNTLIAHFFALSIAVYRFRRINSTVLCLGLVFMLGSLMQLVYQPLLDLGSRELWYGTWVVSCAITVYLLYKVHEVLKVNLAKVTNVVAFTYVVSAFVHAIRYIEREHFGGQYLDAWYYIAINTINISLAVVLLVTAIKDKKEKLVGMYV